jgi:hypothetical protein
MWNVLFEAAKTCQPDASLIGGFIGLSGLDQGTGSGWASLRRSVIWGDVAGFCFEFDSKLGVGDQVAVRYADRDFGLATVLAEVEAVRLIGGKRFLFAGTALCSGGVGRAIGKQRSLMVAPRLLAEAA